MGLGKTIQALALMVARRSTDRKCKSTLIVAPVALLKQWEREIQTKLKPGPRHTLTTFIFHGEKRHTSFERLRTYDVVLTTYGERPVTFSSNASYFVEVQICQGLITMLIPPGRNFGLRTEATGGYSYEEKRQS